MSRYNHRPQQQHFSAATKLLRYLKANNDRFVFSVSDQPNTISFSDASWGVTSYSGNGDRISIGYSTGEIILLESRVVENRAQAEGVNGEDRSEIRARLRMLRFED